LKLISVLKTSESIGLFLLAEFLCGFSMTFFLLVEEFTGILSQLLKSGMGILLAFEKIDKLSIGF